MSHRQKLNEEGVFMVPKDICAMRADGRAWTNLCEPDGTFGMPAMRFEPSERF